MAGWGCSASLLILTGQQWACQLGNERSAPMGWLHYSFPFFFSVCQNVSQSEPSKTTLLPEGASDGFVNNFDQLKGEKKTSFQLFTFQKLSISIWRIQCLSFSLHHYQPNNPNLKSSLGQKKGDQARYTHTLNILLTTFSPGEEESSAHRTLLEGSTFL